MSGGAAYLRGGCLPAVPAPPLLSMRDLTCGEAPRAPSVAFCIVQGSVLPFGNAPCVCFNGRENRGRGRPVSTLSPPHMLPRLGPLFALVRCSAHQMACGARRNGCAEAWKATMDSRDLGSMSVARHPRGESGHPRHRRRTAAIERVLLQPRRDRGRRPRWREERKRENREVQY
jgi:hypothetical protein